jgi:hypothetical protein
MAKVGFSWEGLAACGLAANAAPLSAIANISPAIGNDRFIVPPQIVC